ncbi:MAG: tryptophan synthase subunit alpha [Candidatus Moranbacteria bacterium]|nr:tryptophan synthase subunit alpha [Candidatus Moranbacteria bacterium]
MNKILTQLQKIKKENRLGIMTHIVAGYPSLQKSEKLLLTMAEAGVDFIEMQIPFSDPMADGPTIMKANKVALNNKTKIKDALDLMSKLTKKIDIPLLFMGYFNTIYNYGLEKFCLDANQAGCSGLIFPDIPLDEEQQENYIEIVRKNDLIDIRLLSPASTQDRIKKNARLAKGFVYFVARKGVTGSEKSLDKSLEKNLNKIKKHLKTPIAVGFGISEKAHLNALKGKAEIAVIGSALLNQYNDKGITGVKNFLKKIG